MDELNTLPKEVKQEILNDFKIATESREASLIGRKEVLTGKAKFGIFGDGKEIPQIALAKQFRNGDFRSGYYRDQTWLFAMKILRLEEYFAQLYANTDENQEPSSAGRQMNCHFATPLLDENGEWKNLTQQKNISADISPTAGQMPRLLGLALASKVYKENILIQKDKNYSKFSNQGQEVAFGSIGDASTSEGIFWETINAAGVLQVPLVMSIWDDGYGISVPKKYQTIKESISKALSGFQKTQNSAGYEIFTVKGWDYEQLCLTYADAVKIARKKHIPVIVHVEEISQPQGHSTSGSHERYKSEKRLQWEKDFDGILKMKKWILKNDIATEKEINTIENEAKKNVVEAKKNAWKNYLDPIIKEKNKSLEILENLSNHFTNIENIKTGIQTLKLIKEPTRKDIFSVIRNILLTLNYESHHLKTELLEWYNLNLNINTYRFSSHLYSKSKHSVSNIKEVPPKYNENSEIKDGREILKINFDSILNNNPYVLIFGEDSGKIGGVNQGLEKLQAKHGEHRVFDTGIREATIIGQGIGMAMRGLRPIAEIQYLDYLLYAIQIISDDLATVSYRTKGRQKAPLIIRTRGHRLEGIWHTGSPMGMIINAVRGVNVCVPRDMTRAASMYNTLLESDEPAIVIESLNGYRLKEKLPYNLSKTRLPFGQIEIIKEGNNLTIVTYGSMVKMVLEASNILEKYNISVEIIDLQTLIPFDLNHNIIKSIEKTNKLLIVDEDVPGGCSAYILQKIIEEQNAYFYLDSQPKTLTAKEHRSAYGSDGDYFCKPSVDDIIQKVFEILHDINPNKYPVYWK